MPVIRRRNDCTHGELEELEIVGDCWKSWKLLEKLEIVGGVGVVGGVGEVGGGWRWLE